MPEQDLTFGFNTKFFENAMNRMEKRMDAFKSTTANVARGVTKGFTNITKRLLIVAGGIKGVTKLFDQIPEVGKAFGIAKDIVFKNFLFPLRKAIFPLLQKFLDFIRDNRKTFVVWGQALANVFESVVGAMKSLFAIGKQLGDFFISFVNRTFGLQLKSFQDIINLTIFKIAVAMEFLKSAFPGVSSTLKPIVDLFAEGLGNGIVAATSLIGGFIESLDGINKPIQSILQTIRDIGDAFTTIDENGNKTNTLFKNIGATLGTVFSLATKITDSFLKGMKPAIIALEEPFNKILKAVKDLFGKTENVEKWEKIFKTIGEIVGKQLVDAFNIISIAVTAISKVLEKIIEFIANDKVLNFISTFATWSGRIEFVKGLFGKDETKVDDAIITKRGEVIRTSPDDNIFAFKEFPDIGGAAGASIGNINLDLTVNINESSGVPGAGKEIGMDIVETIRQQLNTELVRIGAV